MFLAKGLEALGIACVMIGLVQGIQSGDMWIELYLSIAGIVVFVIGRFMEKRIIRRITNTGKPLTPD
jgi:membrane-bound ClpP family serine protease